MPFLFGFMVGAWLADYALKRHDERQELHLEYGELDRIDEFTAQWKREMKEKGEG